MREKPLFSTPHQTQPSLSDPDRVTVTIMLIRTLLVSLLVSCHFTVFAQTADQMRSAAEAEQAAVKAYRARENGEFLLQIAKANSDRPNHPRLIYNLAIAKTLNGLHTEALDLLERLAKMGLSYSFERNEDLKPLFENERFKAIVSQIASNRIPINASEKIFEVDDKTLIAESVAFDPRSGSYFVGSVHRRKIIEIDRTGKQSEYSRPEDGLWSVLGLRVDTARGYLWAASSAVPQMTGFKESNKGRAGIFKYDLRTRKLLRAFLLPTGESHLLGDLLVDGEGNVYATDSVSPNIYRIDLRKNEISLFLSSDRFSSLQGLAFAKRNEELFVADYSKGVFRIDVATKAITQMKPADHVTLLGIDGLYYYRGQLIAIQNGVNPNRVVRFQLRGNEITETRTLEANHPDFMEPTLGTLIGDELIYVANSQWPLVNEKAELTLEKLRPPVVLRLNLKKALAK